VAKSSRRAEPACDWEGAGAKSLLESSASSTIRQSGMPNDTTSGILQAKSPMRHLSRILFLLGATFSSVALSHAQAPTLVIEDALQTHEPINHWDKFSTTLSVRVDNPPKPNDEIQVTGPIYTWSGGTVAIPLTSTHGQSTGLQGVSAPTLPLPEGGYPIEVDCTATYTQTWTDRRKTDRLDPINVSGTIYVEFLVLVPKKVKEIKHYPGQLSYFTGDPLDTQTSPFRGPLFWGQLTDYDLQIQDNQSTPQPYPYGKAREEFQNVTGLGTSPNASGPSTWPVGSDFTDHNGGKFNTDPKLPANYVTFDFDQYWHCIEAKPSNPSVYDQDTPLGVLAKHHLTYYYLLPTVRTGG